MSCCQSSLAVARLTFAIVTGMLTCTGIIIMTEVNVVTYTAHGNSLHSIVLPVDLELKSYTLENMHKPCYWQSWCVPREAL